MFHLDGSETSWLVYADWLEDQDIDATNIRESVINPTITEWCWDFKLAGVGVRGGVGYESAIGVLGEMATVGGVYGVAGVGGLHILKEGVGG